MKSKKGSALGWTIGIVFFILFVIGIVVLVIVLNQNTKPNEIKNPANISLYMEAFDNNEKVSITANYKIISGNILNGDLVQNAYTLIGNVSDNILILCSADRYYSTLINKTFSDSEKQYNVSKFDCNLDPIGTLEIHNTGQLQVSGQTEITINLKSQGLFKNIQTCTAWTSGITNVNSEDNFNEIPIPERFANKVDKCYDLGLTLNNNETNINFFINTNILSPLDNLDFYFFDEDYYYDGNFTLGSEYQGNNLGSYNDIKYTINNPNI